MLQTIRRIFTAFLLGAFTFVGFTQSVQAALISTGQVAAANAAQQQRDKIAAALARPGVMAQLEQLGVDPEQARARVNALSDAEAAELAGQIDSLPAGGADIIGALVLIFLVLLVTDLLGLTRVYPFVRR